MIYEARIRVYVVPEKVLCKFENAAGNKLIGLGRGSYGTICVFITP